MAPPAKMIVADKFVLQWAEALGLDPSETRRVVIDAQCGNVLLIYVEKYGTERMLEVTPPDPGSVEIRIV